MNRRNRLATWMDVTDDEAPTTPEMTLLRTTGVEPSGHLLSESSILLIEPETSQEYLIHIKQPTALAYSKDEYICVISNECAASITKFIPDTHWYWYLKKLINSNICVRITTMLSFCRNKCNCIMSVLKCHSVWLVLTQRPSPIFFTVTSYKYKIKNQVCNSDSCNIIAFTTQMYQNSCWEFLWNDDPIDLLPANHN